MDYVCRPAKQSDVLAMYDISVRAHTASYYDKLIPAVSMPAFLNYYRRTSERRQRFRASLGRKLADPAWHVQVAEMQGRVVGYSLAYLEDDGSLTLKGLFVDPNYHQRGIGSALFEAKLHLAGRRHVRLLVIVGNTVAKGLYLRHGFTVTGRASAVFFGAAQDVMERD